MYNLNPLMRNTLITFEEVMFHAQTKHTIDRRQIEQSIIIAEERFISTELGADLYDALTMAKNKVVDSGTLAATQILVGASPVIQSGDLINAYEYMSAEYQALWKQHLWKLTAECVMVSAFPEGFVQFSSEGVFHTVPPAGLMVTSGLVTPLLPSMKWMMDKKIMDRISPLLNSMHRYICKNKVNFSLYGKECEDCSKPNAKWSGIATGLYDETDQLLFGSDRCCDDGDGTYR